MIPAPFRFETLSEAHDRTAFRSGEDALDRYFHTQVTQDARRHVANCFVLVEGSTGAVAAYYTLSAASIPLTDLPSEEAKRLPRYPTMPAVRIGRLAADQRFQGGGLGGLLLMNAVDRTLQDAAAAFALLVDAKNDNAVAFYQRYGFQCVADKPRILFLPVATARKTLLQIRPH
jgi:GNAT superfamily N-acetyltransferase